MKVLKFNTFIANSNELLLRHFILKITTNAVHSFVLQPVYPGKIHIHLLQAFKLAVIESLIKKIYTCRSVS